jgi:hypothetical protein
MMAEREFEGIQHQLASLRRENRFLKVGLIFCLVLSTLPYLTGFQPTVIRASKVVTEKIEFVSDGKTVTSLVVHPDKAGLVIQDENAKGLVFLGKSLLGGAIGVYNRDGRIVADMQSFLRGGAFAAYNDDGKTIASINPLPNGGEISVQNKDGKIIASIAALPNGGAIYVRNEDGKYVIVLDINQYGGRITVRANDETPVAQMRSGRDGGVIVLDDKNGRGIWGAPSPW